MRLKMADEAAEWRIASAGLWASHGMPAAEKTLLVLQARGLDLSAHRAQPVESDLIHSYRLILTMEAGQKEALRAEFRAARGRIFLLSEMAGKMHDIRDPMGSSMVDFEDTAKEIDRLLEGGMERIRRFAEEIPSA